ncbi:MAG: hypothetical protein N2Z72_06065 [Bacteroidales bacterium]|nr:hypothetical protein [Bacteroidales bacterium]
MHINRTKKIVIVFFLLLISCHKEAPDPDDLYNKKVAITFELLSEEDKACGRACSDFLLVIPSQAPPEYYVNEFYFSFSRHNMFGKGSYIKYSNKADISFKGSNGAYSFDYFFTFYFNSKTYELSGDFSDKGKFWIHKDKIKYFNDSNN